MLFDCPDCGEAYADDAAYVTLCPRCQSENTATFSRPLGTEKSPRRGAWAAGVSSAAVVLIMAALAWSISDADGDGLSTYEELRDGSDPFDIDTDGDGIRDGLDVGGAADPMQRAAHCELTDGLLGDCPEEETTGANEALAANASATRMTAWFVAAAVAVAGMVGVVSGRSHARS